MRKLFVSLAFTTVAFCSCQDENSSLGESLGRVLSGMYLLIPVQ